MGGFVTKFGLGVPCAWNACGCFANGENTLDDCPCLSSPTQAPTPEPEAEEEESEEEPEKESTPAPAPTATPAPMMAPTPAPTSAPTSSCAKFCGLTNLRRQNRGCNKHKHNQ